MKSTFAQAFESSPVGMAFLSAEGTVVSANPALVSMLRKTKALVEGVPLATLLRPEEVPRWREYFQAFREGSGSEESLESGVPARRGRGGLVESAPFGPRIAERLGIFRGP